MTGYYNLTWSTACFITPLMMGALCDLNDTYPLILLVVIYAIDMAAFLLASTHDQLRNSTTAGRFLSLSAGTAR